MSVSPLNTTSEEINAAVAAKKAAEDKRGKEIMSAFSIGMLFGGGLVILGAATHALTHRSNRDKEQTHV